MSACPRSLSPRRPSRAGGPLVVAVLLTATGISVLSCGDRPEAPPDVVARTALGDTTVADLEEYILSLPAERRQPAEGQTLVEWRREILEELLVSRQLSREAEEAGLLETEEGRAFVAERWEPLLVSHVREHRVAETVAVTDEELREFYDGNPGEFGHGPQIRVRHIYKRVTREASDEERAAARREIEALQRQLEEGASFTELARSHSDSETAAVDGLIGRLDPGALGPEIDQIVWALDEGEVSDIVSTPVGFHIFRVDDRLEPFHMEFDEARSRLRRRFTRLETEATLDEYFDELVEASGAVYDPEGLDGEDDTVLFALGELELDRKDLIDRVFELGFTQQRSVPLLEHLRGIATQELYRWEAQRLGLADEPELVAARQRIEENALVELAYRARRRAHLEELDDAMLKEYYEDNASRFESPLLLRARLLVRHFEEEGQEWFELYEELERIAEGIREGRLDFADQASRLSLDISAERGGDTGWIRPGAIGEWAGPRASKEIMELNIGVVSQPIMVERYDENQMLYDRIGYMLVRVEEIRPPGAQPFEEVRDRVAEHFVASGSEELQARIRREVLEEIEAVIFEDHL